MAEREDIASIDLASEAGADRCKAVYHQAVAGRCISGVVHDLNNYLGAIMAYADLVDLEEDLAAEPRRMLGEIHAAVGRCSDLLGYLTTLTRSQTPNVNLIDPADIANRIRALRNYRHNISEITTNYDIEAGLPSIAVDLPAMQFALLCLVVNAEENLAEVDTTKLGPRKLTIKVVRSESGGIRWIVRDSGQPLDPPAAERAMAPFTSRHKTDRLGLGLSTAREIAEAHRGTLTYEASEGFAISLPADTGRKL